MVDFALMITALPQAGGDALSSQRLVTAGGGFNVMSAARRQGLDAHYAGQLGQGPFADVALAQLSAEGIRVVVAPRVGMDLGVCVVLVDQSGERSFVTSPGAELTLHDEELNGVTLTGDEVIYVSGYNVVYPQVAQTLSRWLLDVPAQVTVAFDPGPRCADIDAHVLAEVLERTDWLLCNAAEARLLSRDQDAARCAARPGLRHGGRRHQRSGRRAQRRADRGTLAGYHAGGGATASQRRLRHRHRVLWTGDVPHA